MNLTNHLRKYNENVRNAYNSYEKSVCLLFLALKLKSLNCRLDGPELKAYNKFKKYMIDWKAVWKQFDRYCDVTDYTEWNLQKQMLFLAVNMNLTLNYRLTESDFEIVSKKFNNWWFKQQGADWPEQKQKLEHLINEVHLAKRYHYPLYQ